MDVTTPTDRNGIGGLKKELKTAEAKVGGPGEATQAMIAGYTSGGASPTAPAARILFRRFNT